MLFFCFISVIILCMEVISMVDFEKLYFHLFGAMANAVEALEKKEYEKAKEILIAAQQKAEAEYIDAE